MLRLARSRDAQEDQNSTIQSHHILIGKSAKKCAGPCFRNGRDLVHHQSANSVQAVAIAWFDRQAKQRRIGWVGGECAYGDRVCHVETVVLKNYRRTGFPSVVLAARDRPDLATLHRAPPSETASMKSWSSLA
jgi:hypothetical protein